MIWLIIKLALIAVALVAIGTAVTNRVVDSELDPRIAPRPSTKRTDIAGAVGVAILALFLFGCAGDSARPVREITVTKEVPVPYYQPCPKPEDKPGPPPKRVAVEHPAMPADPAQPDGVDWRGVSRILADKVLELFGALDERDAVIEACSRVR